MQSVSLLTLAVLRLTLASLTYQMLCEHHHAGSCNVLTQGLLIDCHIHTYPEYLDAVLYKFLQSISFIYPCLNIYIKLLYYLFVKLHTHYVSDILPGACILTNIDA